MKKFTQLFTFVAAMAAFTILSPKAEALKKSTDSFTGESIYQTGGQRLIKWKMKRKGRPGSSNRSSKKELTKHKTGYTLDFIKTGKDIKVIVQYKGSNKELFVENAPPKYPHIEKKNSLLFNADGKIFKFSRTDEVARLQRKGAWMGDTKSVETATYLNFSKKALKTIGSAKKVKVRVVGTGWTEDAELDEKSIRVLKDLLNV